MIHPYRQYGMHTAGYDVRHLEAVASNPRLVIARRGMGQTEGPLGVPMWAWTLGGGLVGGLVIGAVVWGKGKRKKRR